MPLPRCTRPILSRRLNLGGHVQHRKAKPASSLPSKFTLALLMPQLLDRELAGSFRKQRFQFKTKCSVAHAFSSRFALFFYLFPSDIPANQKQRIRGVYLARSPHCHVEYSWPGAPSSRVQRLPGIGCFLEGQSCTSSAHLLTHICPESSSSLESRVLDMPT